MTCSPSTGRPHPWGAPETGRRSLESVVRLMLTSRFSMWMAWGPELTFFCNDAYRRDTLGNKYPWALGKPSWTVWSEIWDDIGPRVNTVLAEGGGHLGRVADAVPGAARLHRGVVPHVLLQPDLRRRRQGQRPAVRGEGGHRGGHRPTGRWQTLRDLGARRASTPHRGRDDPRRVRGARPPAARDVPFSLAYLFDEAGTTARLAGEHRRSPATTRPPPRRSRSTDPAAGVAGRRRWPARRCWWTTSRPGSPSCPPAPGTCRRSRRW